jgi:hypothetical protein
MFAGFKVLTAVAVKSSVIWVVTACSSALQPSRQHSSGDMARCYSPVGNTLRVI